MRYSIYCLILTVLIISCSDDNQNEKITDSGIKITYFKKGNQDPKLGKVLMINTRYETADGWPILESRPMQPMAMLYKDETVEEAGLLQEVIDNLKIGDSVTFEIPAANLFEVTFDMELPDSIDENSNLKFYFHVEAMVEQGEHMEYIYQKSLKLEERVYNLELENLKKFLADSSITAFKTDEDIYIEVIEEGGELKISEGDSIVVKYTGNVLGGPIFDTGQYPFIVGNGEVIKGWDIGFTYLNDKSKARLYIPSKLGYGSRGSGSIIPPFSTLVFETEVVYLKKKDSEE